MQSLAKDTENANLLAEKEPSRLQSLHNLNILDSPPEERFDRIIRLAHMHFGVPVCRVSLVDRDRVWFKSAIGTDAKQAPRSIAICSHAILSDAPLVSHDLAVDPRFRDSPQVISGPKFRFYAGIPLKLKDGATVGSLCIIDKIAHPNFSEDDVSFLNGLAQIVCDELEAQLDPLTGLLSRQETKKAIETVSTLAKDKGEPFALLYFDCDNFKKTNDTYGHSIGDEVLREIGRRLKSFSCENFSAGRLSGDEFLAVIRQFANQDALGDFVENLSTTLNQPLSLNGKNISMSASIGVCISSNDNDTPQSLIERADMAMYGSKSDGGAKHTFYTQDIQSEVTKLEVLSTDLRSALSNDEFVLNYQPKICLTSDTIDGYEALVRWEHPRFGHLMPESFIALAEKNGFISELGEWVLEAACKFAVENFTTESISVNISSVQFAQNDMVETVERILNKTGLSPERLELEITETVYIDDFEGVATCLEELSRLRVKITLDDFGTGYSNFYYLTKLQLDSIKVDRSLIKRLRHDDKSDAVLKLIMQLGQILGCSIVAEGIETKKQDQYVRSIGCQYAQGFFYGRPQEKVRSH